MSVVLNATDIPLSTCQLQYYEAVGFSVALLMLANKILGFPKFQQLPLNSLRQMDNIKSPVSIVRTLPGPSAAVIAATTDATLKIIDARACNYTHELKVHMIHI